MAAVERVLIVGAGIGGLAMAIALREQGIAVNILQVSDRARHDQEHVAPLVMKSSTVR